MTDPIADMLTRIRNALTAKHDTVEMPASKMKKAIADILLSEGYISGVETVEDGVQGKIVITLKYGPKKEKVISGLKRISKPGLRVYAGSDEIPSALRQGHIAYFINTKDPGSNSMTDGAKLRQVATEYNVTMFTSLDTVDALLDVLEETTLTISTIDA